MKTIDLHTHTTASDGSFTPTELVKHAEEKGLAAVAVTDHDTVNGIAEAMKAAKNLSVELIPGIEISSAYDKLEVHIVGLFVNHSNKAFTDKLEQLRFSREERNRKMIQRLNDLGIDISYSEVNTYAKGGIITRAHFAGVLLQKGYIKSTNEAFKRYIGDKSPAYIPRELPSYRYAAELIREAGGIAILAHPLLYKINADLRERMLTDMKNCGLTGIEAYYSTHSSADVEYIKSLAQKHGLLLSGGSDFHGINKKDLELGTGYGSLAVPYELLDKLKGALNNG